MFLSTVCNPGHYDDQAWISIHRELETYSHDKHVFRHTNSGYIHRKGWEWTHCVHGLKCLDALRAGAAALGVGAGRECLSFYFADHIGEVIASDLYGNEVWTTNVAKEAVSEIIGNPERFCPRRFDSSRLKFVCADGTDLQFDAGRFDFCWSMSSIEHFGGHDKSTQAVAEMARVTKPDGLLAIATEYLLLPEYRHPEYFTRDEICRHLIEPHPSLNLIGDIDWSLPAAEYLIDSIVFPHCADRVRRHVVLNDGNVQWTSILLFYRKV